jgi:uncharacterized membrane protein YcaP (DUF421 family)
MGKREIAQLGIIDLIISILIAELVAMSIEKTNESIFYTLIPISVLVLIEISLAYLSIKSKKIRLLLDGKPQIIIKNGILNYKEMIKSRYSLDDLLMQLRQQSIKSIDEIEYAILEHNGKLSIFKYQNNKKSSYPMPLIIDGQIQEYTLKDINKTKYWLIKKISDKSLKIQDIFYAFYKNKYIYIIKKDKP